MPAAKAALLDEAVGRVGAAGFEAVAVVVGGGAGAPAFGGPGGLNCRFVAFDAPT